MRRFLTLPVIALAFALSGSAAAESSFVFTGHGYGHGVGMGQWGAYGYAQHGWTYDQILQHYYPGTQLGPAPTARIRVLLASGLGSASISSDAAFTATDARGKVTLPAGTYQLDPSLSITVNGKAKTFRGPVRFDPGAEPLSYGKAYRDSLILQVVGGSLSVVNDVTLEHYVDAVVPHEMPVTWNPEALKAQAVAARTYAIVVRKTGTYYDFRNDPVGQAYEGIAEESPQTNAAVAATKGQIVLYDGKPAWTFYSSSSGGRTATLSDTYAGAQDLPYLQSVDDPYDGIAGNPYHDWGPVLFGASALASRLGLPGPPVSLRSRPSPDGRCAVLVAKGDGWVKEIPGPTLRKSLGLRSTLFDVKRQGAPSGAGRVRRAA